MSFGSSEQFYRGGGNDGPTLASFFGAEGGKGLEDRISQLGSGIPKLDQDLLKMQHEIQILVERYTEANKAAKGA